MKFYLGVTDNNWFKYLSNINPEDINFWQPGGTVNFKVLQSGAPFLFKLRSPLNAIGGIGETPIDWGKSIVQGKSYDSNDAIGRKIWSKVEILLEKYLYINSIDEGKSQFLLEEPESPAYGNSVLTKVRLGQGAFRVLVTDAYSRRCSITGEKTLPVLEAAHIKPYAESGPHFISNGLLLRSDMHKLFDGGYLTITNDLKIEVSSRIKEEFHNGKEYYQYHGKDLLFLPNRDLDKPNEKYIDWHNTNIYRG